MCEVLNLERDLILECSGRWLRWSLGHLAHPGPAAIERLMRELAVQRDASLDGIRAAMTTARVRGEWQRMPSFPSLPDSFAVPDPVEGTGSFYDGAKEVGT
jgi:hypothetical protein